MPAPAYRAEYEAFQKKAGDLDPDDPRLLDLHLLPDPDKVRIRVYATQSTHKSLSSLRQGSMIMVNDDDFASVDGRFEEAFFTHTSTSPNQQIIASLDVARRQAELEGYELVIEATPSWRCELRREVNGHPLISKYFRILTPAEMIPAELRKTGLADYGPPHSTWKEVRRRVGQRRVRARPDAADADVRHGRLRRHRVQGPAGRASTTSSSTRPRATPFC